MKQKKRMQHLVSRGFAVIGLGFLHCMFPVILSHMELFYQLAAHL